MPSVPDAKRDTKGRTHGAAVSHRMWNKQTVTRAGLWMSVLGDAAENTQDFEADC